MGNLGPNESGPLVRLRGHAVRAAESRASARGAYGAPQRSSKVSRIEYAFNAMLGLSSAATLT